MLALHTTKSALIEKLAHELQKSVFTKLLINFVTFHTKNLHLLFLYWITCYLSCIKCLSCHMDSLLITYVYFILITLFVVKESYYTKPIEETKPQPERSAIVSAHSKTAGPTSSNKGIFGTACIHFFVCLNIKFNFFMELHFITKLNSTIVF